MVTTALPVPRRHDRQGAKTDCPTCQALSKELQEKADAQPHLWDYLHTLPKEKAGAPIYVEALTRSHRDLPDPNLIYSASENTLVHIRSDLADSRNFYVAIEPGMSYDLTEVVNEVELHLVDIVHQLEGEGETPEARRALLLQSLEKVCSLGPLDDSGEGKPPWARRGDKIVLGRAMLEVLKYRILRDKEGMGPLQVFIQDPNIEDISCSGLGAVFVEHKVFGSLKSTVTFQSHEELDSFVIRLSEKIGKPVTFRDPVVDAVLPDGSRINIVFGGDISKRGSNFTIRKFATTPMSIIDLIAGGSISSLGAAYLSLLIGEGMSVFVSGETASGKTTLMNALTVFVPPNAKIVSIEDTPELQLPHPNWTREVIRGSTKVSSGSAVTMFDLLKAALRQRPNEIMIGEIRGEEGAIAFQAMQTGHPVMATFHASTVEKLIQRLTGNPINVPKAYMDNLNVVVIQSAVRLPNGKPGRRVMSINEIVGYDSASDAFSFIETFRWDPVRDILEFTGNFNSYLLEERIAPKRGISVAKKRDVYKELELRAQILTRLQEQKVSDFYALFTLLAQASRKGLFR